MSTKEQVLTLLGKLNFPETSHSLVDLQVIDAVDFRDGRLELRLKLPDPNSPMKDRIQNEVTNRVGQLPEVESVDISFVQMAPEEQTEFRKKVLAQVKEQQAAKLNVKNVVAVCSGKGGVGKSTITANLSVALSRMGFTVGLLDADVYGFSIPRMMGVNNQQPQADGDLLIPIESDGVKIISIGFFVPDSEAVIWRGPLLHKAITQFIEDVKWGELDFLMIDLPPGTGDVTISIAQKLPDAKLLIVTTPQISAYNVAARVGAMANKTNLKVLGVVENMSYFVTESGKKEFIFGQGGGRILADNLHTELLGQIPLVTALREASDQGKPYSTSEAGAELFLGIAGKLT